MVSLRHTAKNKKKNVKRTQKKNKKGGKVKKSVALALSLGALASSFWVVSGELSNHKKKLQKRLNKLKKIDDDTKNNVMKIISNTSDKDLKKLEKYAKKGQQKWFDNTLVKLASIGVTLSAGILAVMYKVCKNDAPHENDTSSYVNSTNEKIKEIKKTQLLNAPPPNNNNAKI